MESSLEWPIAQNNSEPLGLRWIEREANRSLPILLGSKFKMSNNKSGPTGNLGVGPVFLQCSDIQFPKLVGGTIERI